MQPLLAAVVSITFFQRCHVVYFDFSVSRQNTNFNANHTSDKIVVAKIAITFCAKAQKSVLWKSTFMQKMSYVKFTYLSLILSHIFEFNCVGFFKADKEVNKLCFKVKRH